MTMKKFVFFLSLIWAGLLGQLYAANANLLIAAINAQQGESQDVPVYLSNPGSYSAVEFDLYLPTGLAVETDDDGYYIVNAGTSTTRQHFADAELNADGSIHMSVSSSRNTAFSNASTVGEVLNFSLLVTSDIPNGVYSINVKNITLRNTAKETFYLDDIEVKATISDGQENANYLSVEGFTVEAGQQVTLPVMLTNTVDIAVLQFDLKMPAGFTLAVDADGDEMVTVNAERSKGKHMVSCREQSDGTIRFVVSSLTNAVFVGKQGEVLSIVLDVARSVEAGNYEVELINQVLSTPALNEYNPEDFVAEAIITKNFVKVSEISLPTDRVILYTGYAIHFPVTVAPANADDASYEWIIENPDVCAVDADGNLQALSKGVSRLRVKTNDGTDLESTCSVVVSDLGEPAELIYDINQDGTVNIGDVTKLAEFILKKDAQ